jgi:DNA polymerase III epsilon subunit-like protein
MMADDRLPEVIELYMELVNLTNGEMVSFMDHLIKPSKPVTDEIVGITGITNEMLADKPPFKAIAETAFMMIEAAPVVIAHNCHFDRECLDIEAGRMKYLVNWPRTICSVEQTCHFTGKRLTLSQLHEFLFQEKFADAHRAKTDVKALTRCCCELFQRGEL